MKCVWGLSGVALVSFLSVQPSVAMSKVAEQTPSRDLSAQTQPMIIANPFGLAQAQPSPDLVEARRRARILREHYPGWKDALDACPCTRNEAQANSRFADQTYPIITERYHPGAEWEYRSSLDAVHIYTSPTLPVGSPSLIPGQQCTYSADGLLITGGTGAGTPDAYAPVITLPGEGLISDNSHTFWDVTPADSGMSWREYHQTWTPNNANGCPDNSVSMFITSSFVDTEISVNPGGNYSG